RGARRCDGRSVAQRVPLSDEEERSRRCATHARDLTRGIRLAHGHQGCGARRARASKDMWRIDTDLNAVWAHGTEMSHRNQSVVLVQSQHNIINSTNTGNALDDCVEHRPHVCRRAADDAEHLGSCRLMLQGLPQVCIALLEFLEQSHVLYSDHRLVGKGFEESDLLIGKWTHLIASN